MLRSYGASRSEERFAVKFRQLANSQRFRHAPSHGCFLVLVRQPFPGKVQAPAVTELNNHRRVGHFRRFQARVRHRRHGAVHRGDGVPVVSRVVHHVDEI